MDSQWFHQETGSNGCYHDKNDAGNVVDLTLKLGLGNHGGRNHRLNLSHLFNTLVAVTTFDLANFNFSSGSNTSANKGINFEPTDGAEEHVGLNPFGTINTGYSGLNANGINCGGRNIAAEIDFGMMTRGDQSQDGQTYNSLAQNMGNQHPSINSSFSNSFNLSLPPSNTLNTYTQLNDSSRDGQVGSSYGSRRRGSRRSRQICYFDPNKRCTNFNCNTRDTPMWRKGPLGPKSLCNACGIKYRKEKDRRRARGATNKRNSI